MLLRGRRRRGRRAGEELRLVERGGALGAVDGREADVGVVVVVVVSDHVVGGVLPERVEPRLGRRLRRLQLLRRQSLRSRITKNVS